MEEGNCECELCDFRLNVDGSVWMNGIGIFCNWSLVKNEGYCGGFCINDSVLSLFGWFFLKVIKVFLECHTIILRENVIFQPQVVYLFRQRKHEFSFLVIINRS
jgi:hypothetical protein